jgi:MFS family permease
MPEKIDTPAHRPATEPSTETRRRTGLLFLGLAVAAVGFTMALQMAMNANFLADEIHVTGFQLGMLEAVRESCGVAAFVILALLAGWAEPIVGSVMLLLVALGLGSYGFVPNYLWVVLLSLVWSQGLHVWMPLPNSMILALAEPGRAGHRLGQMQAAGAIGSGIGLAAALACVWLGVKIRPLYIAAGAMAVFAALACWQIPRDIKTPGPRLVFRRRYSLYYLLSFLEGWRKQIFLCFAGFLLVRIYKTDLATMLLLWMAVNTIGYFVSPRVGRLIDRIGERKVLVFYYACLTGVFIGYALIPNRYVLYALFVVDSAFFVLTTALTTFVNRIAPPSEHTATLSMGVAMNHVAAVSMPFIGGLLWVTLGYQWAFAIGAVAAVFSIVVSLRVPKHVRTAPEAQR